MAVSLTDKILQEIQIQLKDALENAKRERELAYRAIARIDQFEARFDSLAADIRTRLDNNAADIRSIRSDIASIDVKLTALPEIEMTLRAIKEIVECPP